MKKGCMVFLIAVLVVLFTGCNMSTTINADESGKGTVSYKMNLKKEAFEGADYIVAKDVDEFAAILSSKFDPSLNLSVSVDKTSSNEENIIVVSYSYNTVEEYNQFVDDIIKKCNSLISGTNIYEIYGYDKEENDKDYTIELKALNSYLTSQGIEIDTNHRNCRKFVKILKEYVQEAKIRCGVRQTKEINKEYAKIVEDENGKNLCVNYMALNCIDMYTKKIVEKNKSEFFKTEYIDQNEKELTNYGNEEVLRRTFESFDLSTKIKNAIDDKNGCTNQTYSMNDFTPVMTVKLFSESVIEEFKNAYVTQRRQYEEERNENINNLKLSFDEMEDMYSERTKNYEIVYGNNKISFTDEEIFDLYNDDGFICINSKGNAQKTNGVEKTDSKENINHEEKVNNKGVNVINNKDYNMKSTTELDNTPLTSDFTYINIIILVAIISLLSIIIIFCVEKKNNRM